MTCYECGREGDQQFAVVGELAHCSNIGACDRRSSSQRGNALRASRQRVGRPRLKRVGDCLVWTGSKNAAGYAVVRDGAMTILLHRLVAAIVAGEEIAAGDVVMHSCDVRACVEPKHLSPGSQRENVRQMVGRGRNGSTVSAPVVHR